MVVYIEWRKENKDVRAMLLYFQELYITNQLRPIYFSKGNLTSARNILEFCNEAKVDPLNYIKLNFMSHLNDVKTIGFRYFNTNNYKINYINKVLEPGWYGAGTVPSPVYDGLRYHIKPFIKKDIDKLRIISDLINGDLRPEPFLYLVKTGYLDLVDYAEVLAVLNKTMLEPMKKINLWYDRGVLPPDVDTMLKYKTFIDYCNQDEDEVSDSAQAQ